MRILLIEDDKLLSKGIKTALTRQAYQVDTIFDGAQGLTATDTDHFSLIILDLTLPTIDGLDILKHMRQNRNQTPVLILTARDALEEKIAGLDLGADDYLVKPFDLAELNARVRALIRRQSGHAEPLIEHLGLAINPANREVQFDGEQVELSRREYALLMELLAHPGRVFSKAKLEDTLYGWDTEVESNSIEVHVHHLRKKLFPGLIKTVRGIGYKLETSL